MKTYIVFLLLVTFALVTYAVVLPQLDSFKVWPSRNYGTISTSLGSPFLGSSSAPITIIEFGNYQCQECKKWFQETKPLIGKNYIDTGKINMIFIDMEPPNKSALLASEATYCANEQEKYWDYHNILFSSQIENEADAILLKKFASDIGLDRKLFDECLDSGKYEKKIKYNTHEAMKNGVKRLPTFIIINSVGKYEKIVGPQPFSVFEKVIESML